MRPIKITLSKKDLKNLKGKKIKVEIKKSSIDYLTPREYVRLA